MIITVLRYFQVVAGSQYEQVSAVKVCPRRWQLYNDTCYYFSQNISSWDGAEVWYNGVQWWFVNPDTFVPSRYFRINKFSGLLNLPSVQKRKFVPALFVLISEISGLSEPRLTKHHCIHLSGSLFYISTTWWVSVLVDQWVPEGTCSQVLRSTSVDSV